MATAVNNTNFEVFRSINTPDFPTASFVINSPNLDTLVGSGTDVDPEIPKRYWIVDPPASQTLREMTAPEKAVVDVDAGVLSQVQTTQKLFLQNSTDAFVRTRYSDKQQQNLTALVGTVSGQQKVLLDSYLDWYQSVYDELNTQFTNIDNASTAPAVEAITINFSPFASSDPNVTVSQILAATPGAVVGEGFSVYDTTVTTSTSNNFVTKVELASQTLAAGTYTITVSYGWNLDDISSDIEVRLQEDSGGGYADLGEIHKQEPKDSAGVFGITGSDQRFYATRIVERVLVAGTYSWRVQFRSENFGTEASMWETLLRVEGVE